MTSRVMRSTRVIPREHGRQFRHCEPLDAEEDSYPKGEETWLAQLMSAHVSDKRHYRTTCTSDYC